MNMLATNVIALSPIKDEIYHFCAEVIRSDIHLAALQPDQGKLLARWFGCDASAATEWAFLQNAGGSNVYWTPNIVRRELHRKPVKSDITEARFLQVDVDPPKDGSDWDRGAVLAELNKLNPSFVISSGNGLQAFWRLEEHTTEISSVEALNRAIMKCTSGDPACWNADRLMRMPGTVNHPNSRKRGLGRVPAAATLQVPETNPPISLTDLKNKFGFRATNDAVTKEQAVNDDKQLSESSFIRLTAADLAPVAGSRLIQLIERPKGEDRSDDVMSCAIEMAQLGYPECQMLGVLMNSANAVHAHIADQLNPLRACQRAVAEARKFRAEAVFSKPATLPLGAIPFSEGHLAKVVPFVETEGPRALRRKMPAAEPFPLMALGGILGPAARAIVDRVQCPDAMAAQAVLGVASLAVQGHVNVILPPNGKLTPTSLFLVTVAGTGERKSAADSEALWPAHKYEAALRAGYRVSLPSYENSHAAYQSARTKALGKAGADLTKGLESLEALGPAPKTPLEPMLLVPEPTLEGLHRLFAVGQPALGLFSDEGGQFVGGNGMNSDNRLKTSAGLSDLWDGKPIRRVRAGDGASIMAGRRLASHLMMQPDVAAQLLSDPVLKDQGLLSRLLVAAPRSLAGTRFQRPREPSSDAAMSRYGARLLSIFEASARMVEGTLNELDPRPLPLSEEARALWSEFADEIERRLAPGGDLEPVRGFANKLPEHSVRLAAVILLVDDLTAETLSVDAMQRGIHLARFYAGEALRLFDASSVSPPIRKAETLLEWLHLTWDQPQIGLRQVYQFGPNAIREAAKARDAVSVLVEHGWLTPIIGGATIIDQRCREAWEIHR